MTVADNAKRGPPGLHQALLAAAGSSPAAIALRHKHRGVWLSWDWRAVVRSVDVVTTAFARAGVGSGDRVAIVGEVTPSLLFSALAADALAAELLAMPPAATTADILAASADGPLRLAVIQGRDTLSAWQRGRAKLGGIRILFDHAAPGAQHDGSISIFNDIMAGTAPSFGWADRLGAAAADRRADETLWVEASTDWPRAVEAAIGRWLRGGTVLALPELLTAAARDRAEIRPGQWIASSASFAAAARDIAGRLPEWLRARHGKPGRSYVQRQLSRLARSRLGLANLNVIYAEAGRPDSTDPHAEIFATLGIEVRPLPRPGDERPGSAHHPAPKPVLAPVGTLS